VNQPLRDLESMPRLVTGAAALDLYQYVALWLLPRELVAWEAPYAAPRREPYRHEWLSVDSQSYRTVGAAQFILGSACRGLRI